jgi:outer membrane immunogenic protein
MKKLAIVLTAGAALAAAPPAFAQDGAQDGSTFTGPRVEALIGYDINKAGSTIDNDANPNDDESAEGLLYGIGAGYDLALGNAVVGVEGEFSDSTAKTKFENGDFEGFGLGRVGAGRDLYVGARAGFLVSPRTLIYAKGGYTNARYNVLARDGTTRLRESFDADGWRLGAGAEMALGQRTYAKLEYRYSNYSRGEVDFEDPDIPDSRRFDIDTDRHQIVAGVGVRF